MFVSFEPLVFLLWLFVTTFIPGAILSFSLLRKDELNFLEKLFIGFAVGFVLLPLPPFVLYLFAGVEYSNTLAMVSVAILYVLALGLFVWTKTYEDLLAFFSSVGSSLSSFKMPSLDFNNITISQGFLISLFLLIVLIFSYVIRLSSYSPIFQELDPYFYTYAAQQILTVGHNPFNDQTAWYPDLSVNHRTIPAISYLESVWYSFYTGGGAYDNMKLALVASMYPPIAATFMVFFIYLLVSAAGKREWGVIAAGIAAFMPVLVYKLAAGEQEIQPYGFFSLFFFFAMYALSLKRKDFRFPVLAGIALAAMALGSSTSVLAIAVLVFFIICQSIFLYLRDEDSSGLRHFLLANIVIFFIGSYIGTSLLMGLFSNAEFTLANIHPNYALLASLIFCGGLFALKEYLPDRSKSHLALGAFLLAGIALYAFTPAGNVIRDVARGGFEITQYHVPLDRTIAEQGLAGGEFGSQMGFVADTYPAAVNMLLWPVRALFSQTPQISDGIVSAVSNIVSVIFMVVSLLVNAFLGVIITLLNASLNSNVAFDQKPNSLMLLWIFLFCVSAAYALLRFYRKEDNALPILFVALVMPPVLVGIIKAKYTIYAAAMLAVAIGFVFSSTENLRHWLSSLFSDRKKKKAAHEEPAAKGSRLFSWLLAIGAILILLQFLYASFSVSLAWGATKPLFQNNPSALAPKFQQICAATNDTDVCAAAADPAGYANKGTNYQYNQKLCMLSLYSDPSYLYNSGAAPSWESQSAYFRCQRISSYWIDSMEWLKNNTPPGSRVISWWDYGHWINYFGDRNAVIRNEHSSMEMIGTVADAYVHATPEELKAVMKRYGAKYALFDIELVGGGGSLGGKYGALNYLACAWSNETSVSRQPGDSACEANHLWETVFVTPNPCTISETSAKYGMTAYKMYAGDQYLPYYPPFCINPSTTQAIGTCANYIRAVPAYCLGEALLANGQTTYAFYSLNETAPNGDLKLHKANIEMPYSEAGTYHFGNATGVTLMYTNSPVWLENGEVKSGYEDRVGMFYDSNLYRALFLNALPGFKLVYTTPDGAVKIYKIEE